MILKQNSAKIRVAVLCGGPSLERGISLNSARSVMDHLESLGVEITPIYFDEQRNPYKISRGQLYSNTPSDFDFKLDRAGNKLTETQLVKTLKQADLVFPCIHGAFGEDGELQSFLEKHNVPFVGSGSVSCKKAFDKWRANEYIRARGFYSPNSIVLKITDSKKEIKDKIAKFWKKEKIRRAIVKPAAGGSSIGVFSVDNVSDAAKSAETLFSKRMDTRVVVERFAEGKEFTVIILQNKFNMPVAVLPTEIEVDYDRHQFFDFRKKYLPTRQVTYHCPPRFSNEMVEKIQIQAEQLFSLLGMRDFARFDGFLMPDGNIWFSDFNPVSGMEQNSFLFQQPSRIGFSHQDLLRYVVNRAMERRGINKKIENILHEEKRKPLAVLFGGDTAEKQTSLMSGTNVWLKLRGSRIYEPLPYLLYRGEVWELPYSYILNHTVEEIYENAKNAPLDQARLEFLVEKARIRLALEAGEATLKFFLPRKITLEELFKGYPFIFLGLHGGIGEDGTLQKYLEKRKKKFNGSGSETSRLCMDKWAANELVSKAGIKGVSVASHVLLPKGKIRQTLNKTSDYWNFLANELGSKHVIAKPRGDGCSAGVVRLHNEKDLQTYLRLSHKCEQIANPGTFTDQEGIIHMPETETDIIFEAFIETDRLRVAGGRIAHTRKSGYVEMTVGVLEDKSRMRALSPSITVAESSVLSVEEKFQGGTGVNLTPPPREIISDRNVKKIKELVVKVAKKLGIRGYARIDIFANINNGEIMVIEANTLPGLTPSTVIYHQALAENPPVYPTEFLEKIIKNGQY